MVLPVFPVAFPNFRWWFVKHQGKMYFSQEQLRKVKKNHLKVIIPAGKLNHENPFLRVNASVFPVAIPNFRWWFDRHKTTSIENCQSTE